MAMVRKCWCTSCRGASYYIFLFFFTFLGCSKKKPSERAIEIVFDVTTREASVGARATYQVTGHLLSEEGLANALFLCEWDKGRDTLLNLSVFEDSYHHPFEITLTDIRYDITIIAKAYDRAGRLVTDTFRIKLAADAQFFILSHQPVSLGAQSNLIGHFYNAYNNEKFTPETLTADSLYHLVDFVYYYGLANQQALYSPKAITLIPVTWDGKVAVNNWGTKANQTGFRKALPEDFADATYYWLESFADSNFTSLANGAKEPPEGLMAGDVYMFRTVKPKMGILRVLKSVPGASGFIQFEVKIQE